MTFFILLNTDFAPFLTGPEDPLNQNGGCETKTIWARSYFSSKLDLLNKGFSTKQPFNILTLHDKCSSHRILIYQAASSLVMNYQV